MEESVEESLQEDMDEDEEKLSVVEEEAPEGDGGASDDDLE